VLMVSPPNRKATSISPITTAIATRYEHSTIFRRKRSLCAIAHVRSDQHHATGPDRILRGTCGATGSLNPWIWRGAIILRVDANVRAVSSRARRKTCHSLPRQLCSRSWHTSGNYRDARSGDRRVQCDS
jgi:hypothetical protein